MKKINLNLTLFAMLLICACSVEKQNLGVYHIDEILKTEKTITFSDLKSEVKHINLETTSESIFNSADKVIYTDQFIFILSPHPNKVLQFTSNGEFVRVISGQGKSGEEYIFANDIFINNNKNRLYINDMGGGKIIEYDMEGNFINTKNIGKYVMNSNLIDGDLAFESVQVVLGNEPYKLFVRNQLGDTISSHVNNIKYKLSNNSVGYADTKSLFELNNEIVYHQMSSDTVFTYNKTTKNLDFRYLFKNSKPLIADDYEQLFDRLFTTIFIYDVAEDNHYIYVTIHTQNLNKHLYLIDKSDNSFYKADFMLKKSMDIKKVADKKFYPKWQNGDVLIDCVQLEDESNPTIVFITPK